MKDEKAELPEKLVLVKDKELATRLEWDGDVFMNNLFPYSQEFDTGRILYLGYISENLLEAAEKLGIPARVFKKYRCPYIKQSFRWAIPEAVLTAENSPLFQRYVACVMRRGRMIADMALDEEWNRNKHNLKGDVDLTKIGMCALGPGYVEGCLLSDGFSTHEHAIGRLNSGDLLLCITNVWWNK